MFNFYMKGEHFVPKLCSTWNKHQVWCHRSTVTNLFLCFSLKYASYFILTKAEEKKKWDTSQYEHIHYNHWYIGNFISYMAKFEALTIQGQKEI